VKPESKGKKEIERTLCPSAPSKKGKGKRKQYTLKDVKLLDSRRKGIDGQRKADLQTYQIAFDEYFTSRCEKRREGQQLCSWILLGRWRKEKREGADEPPVDEGGSSTRKDDKPRNICRKSVEKEKTKRWGRKGNGRGGDESKKKRDHTPRED